MRCSRGSTLIGMALGHTHFICSRQAPERRSPAYHSMAHTLRLLQRPPISVYRAGYSSLSTPNIANMGLLYIRFVL